MGSIDVSARKTLGGPAMKSVARNASIFIRFLTAASSGEGAGMPFCTRVKDVLTPEDDFIDEARRCEAEASRLPPGSERDALLKRARQANTAAHISNWAESPGLKPPG